MKRLSVGRVESYEDGFTLLEVLIATVVVGLALAGLMSFGGTSARGLARAQDRAEQSMLAEERLRDVVRDAETGTIPQTGFHDGSYEPPFDHLRWEIEVEEDSVPLPEGAGEELRSSSSVFARPTSFGRVAAGKEEPSLRRITVRVFRDDEGPADAIPYVGFVVSGVEPLDTAPLGSESDPAETGAADDAPELPR